MWGIENRREKVEVKTKWSNVRQESKATKANFLKEVRKTGGRENLANQPTEMDELVCTIIGKESVEGIEGGLDCEDLSIGEAEGSGEEHQPTVSATNDEYTKPKKKFTTNTTSPMAAFEENVLYFYKENLKYKKRKLEILERVLEIKEVSGNSTCTFILAEGCSISHKHVAYYKIAVALVIPCTSPMTVKKQPVAK